MATTYEVIVDGRSEMESLTLLGMHIVDPLAYFMKIAAMKSMDDANELSRRDEKVLRLLKKYRNIAKRKKLIPFPPDVLNRLGMLRTRYPHAQMALDEIMNEVRLAQLDEGFARIPNILLVGPPGSGKSTLAKAVAELVWGRTGEVHYINFPSLSASFELAGGDAQWDSADTGRIAKIMAHSEQANVMIIADEVDKSGFDSSRYASPTTVLYHLLERHSSRSFIDVGLDHLKIDCSACSWFLTANDLAMIPAPIVSRCRVVHVDYPETAEEIAMVTQSIWADLREEMSWGKHFSEILSDAVIDTLAGSPPREIRHILHSAAGRAVVRCHGVTMAGKDQRLPYSILSGDVIRTTANRRARRIGFIW